MKIITAFVLSLILFICNLSAQNCDIATNGVAIFNATNTSPISTVTVGQNAYFKFSIYNAGTEPTCTIPANSVTALFDFTTTSGSVNTYIYDSVATFVSGYFTWVYNNLTGVLTGTNTTAIPNGLGDVNILVKVKGNAPGTGVSHLDLSQGNGVSDNPANNHVNAQLIITAASVNSYTICPGSPASFVAPVLAGNTYQWQVDTGSGFVNIADNANYTGTTTAFLTVSYAPTSWYGYKYQCKMINGAVTSYTNPLILKFAISWIGGSDTAWENPLNWGCSGLPDSNTDVFITTGIPHNPKINSNASCRSLNLQTGITIEVKTGFRIDITGHD